MKEVNDLFNNLYKNLILRDLLSFIIPGAIVVIPLFFPHVKPYIKPYLDRNDSLSFPEGAALVTLLFGLFFMVGFTVQCLGAEVLKILIFYNKENFPASHNQSTFKVYFTHMIEIGESDSDAIKNRFERFVALKQMCGNCSLALLISGIYLHIYYLCGYSWIYLLFPAFTVIFYLLIASQSNEKLDGNNIWLALLFYLLVTVILAIWLACSICLVQYVPHDKFIALLSVSMQILSIILLYGHYVHVERQDDYMLTAIKYIQLNPRTLPTSSSQPTL